MVVTITLLLALNAVYLQSGGNTDYWVTLPAASVMFFWDLTWGWLYRHERREISRRGRMLIERRRVEQTRMEQILRDKEEEKMNSVQEISPESSGYANTSFVPRRVVTAAQARRQSCADSVNCDTTADDVITPTFDSIRASSPSPKHQQEPAVTGLMRSGIWMTVNHSPMERRDENR